MLDVDVTTIRLFLHVLAACFWVGGQLTLAALVPVLRRIAPDAAGLAARQFNRIGWPAYGLLLLTGAWNTYAERAELHGSYARTYAVKVAVVALSGVAAYAHTRTRVPSRVALLGALSGLAALSALFLGVLLAG